MRKLVLIFVGLSTLDIALTFLLVTYGMGMELNPIMAKVLSLPLPVIIAYKIGLPLIIGLALYLFNRNLAANPSRHGMVRPEWVLKVIVIGLAAVCVFNISGMLGGLI